MDLTNNYKMIVKNPTQHLKPIVKKTDLNIKVICCSGGDEYTGHPAVYYNFGNKKQITCQYCGTIYSKSK